MKPLRPAPLWRLLRPHGLTIKAAREFVNNYEIQDPLHLCDQLSRRLGVEMTIFLAAKVYERVKQPVGVVVDIPLKKG